VFHFADRSDAAEFIAELGNFGRWGNFQVYYKRDHIGIFFPLQWVGGLAERYRRKWARWVEEARPAATQEPREPRPPHPTVLVDGVEIDEDLAPLIRKLWDAGIKTRMCCQERELGTCWVQFLSPCDAMKFFGPASLLASDCHWSLDDHHDLGDDFEANPIGCVLVEFPREDLGELTRLWRPGAGGGG
jgi:hypothetical protein